MDLRFKIHNSHLDNPKTFAKNDPYLRELRKLPLQYRYSILDSLPRDCPGIYTITGGRQIGKTTLLKMWMSELLDSGITPEQIAYFSGELIDDHHSLVNIITEQLDNLSDTKLSYIILDEITYIRNWDKGIKFIADAGLLSNCVMILTGSDSIVIREARMRFPGRRGSASVVDFHLFPLTFLETVKLKRLFTIKQLDNLLDENIIDFNNIIIQKLFKAFDDFLLHGGYLTAINDLKQHNEIRPATFNTYCDWIRGDILKRGKQENYLREILNAIIKRYGSQITWNNLSADLSIDHPATIADYVELLTSLDVLFVQHAIREDKLSAAPKKAKKVMMTDPFIFHSVRSWLQPVSNPFKEQASMVIKDKELAGKLTEASVATHIKRFFPTYYIKGKGEVDIAYVDGKTFFPIEIKWTKQIRSKDLKQVVKYPNARIWSKSFQFGKINELPLEPLPIALLRFGTG